MSARSPKNKSNGQRYSKPGTIKWSWRSLTWQMIILTILPLTVLVLAVAFGSLTIHQNAMRTLVGERDARAVRTAAAALEEQINHRTLAIRNLAMIAGNADGEKLDGILASFDYMLEEFDGGLALFRPDGKMEAMTGNQELWAGLKGQISQLVQNQFPGSGSPTTLSSAFTDPETGDPLVLVLAVSQDGQWVAAGAFTTEEMARHTLAEAFTSGPGASIIMMDGEKRLLYEGGTFTYNNELADHPGVAEALKGESGTQYITVGKEEHVVVYSPIAPVGWALILEEPWEVVETPTLRLSQTAPLVLVPVLILAVIALWFGAHQIVKPLQTLETRAARLAWGDFDAIEKPVGGVEEIRQLQNELIHMAHKVRSAQQSLHGYIGAITAAQEEERRRLARELHDDTIQALIALKQRVQLSQLAAAHSGPEAAALLEVASLTEQTIENLRRLTRALRPIYLEDLGLVTALEMLAGETGQALNIPVTFQRLGVEKRLVPTIELALFRMTQEAVSNIARHAQATQASIQINFSDSLVSIEVNDNGKGFAVPKSPAEYAPNGHYGLLGLYERAELIRAGLEIHSESGQGTRVKIKLSV